MSDDVITDEAVAVAAEAISRAWHDDGVDHAVRLSVLALTAALPVLERQLRAKIADEIGALPLVSAHASSKCSGCMYVAKAAEQVRADAAEIARGSVSS